MILVNEIETGIINKVKYEILLRLLAPFAHHFAEEVWNKLNHKTSIHLEPWPKYDPKLVEENTFQLIVQINGKVRDKFEISTEISEAEATNLTLSREKVKSILGNNKPKKIIFVPKRLINFVI